FFVSSRRRHTSFSRDWSSDVCSSDLAGGSPQLLRDAHHRAARARIGLEFRFASVDRLTDQLETRLEGLRNNRQITWQLVRLALRSEERRVGKECRTRGARGAHTKHTE